VQRGVRPRPERHQTVRVPDLKSGPSYSAILPSCDRLLSVSGGVMGAQGLIHRTPTPRGDRPPDPCCPHHLGTKSPDHTVAPTPRRANATCPPHPQPPFDLGASATAHTSTHYAGGRRLPPRPRPPRRRARRKAPRKFAERTRSAVCAGPHPPAECLQRRGERGPRVHPCAQELAGKPPPAHCRSRRRSRAAGPASPAGGWGWRLLGGISSPAVGAARARACSIWLPSHPY